MDAVVRIVVMLALVSIICAVVVLVGRSWASGVAMALLVLVLPGATLSYAITPRADIDLRATVALASSIGCSLVLGAVLTVLDTTDATTYATALGALTLAFAVLAMLRAR